MKKIVIFNGSPRIKGNTTCLIDSFIKGAKENGNEIKVFNLHKMNIHPCLGCYCGGKIKNSPCVQKDDMDKVYPVFREADLVVFASPLYYWTFSGQLKCLIDRLYAHWESFPIYNEVPGKDACLLMCGTGNDFEPVSTLYKTYLKNLRWKNRGMVLVDSVTNVGDITGNPKLDDAYELGKSIK